MNARLSSLIGAVASLTITAQVVAGELGYYSQPALHGDRIVFVSEGDLWSASRSSNSGDQPITAYRLTSSDGRESLPRISPDGRRVAFAAQYEGNTDVYVMPIDGGSPTRLTFHPAVDEPLTWTPDGQGVLLRSGRANPLGRVELYRVSIDGGMPVRYDFGECSMIGLSPTGNRFAFTRWSNENWSWKRYRGGTAPEIWVGEFNTGDFFPLTDHDANDLFPMWLQGRVFFLSDRDGTANLFSDAPRGGSLQRHTSFLPVDGHPTAIDGYDVRWPSAEAGRNASRIIFCQGGSIVLVDCSDNSIQRLDIQLASDRVAARRRLVDPMKSSTEFSLSSDGKQLLVGTRGEIYRVDMKTGRKHRLTRSSGTREWGAKYLGTDRVAMISDNGGQQQVVSMPADGSKAPGLLTEDREVWLFPPATSSDGRWIAFGDKTMRLHVLDMLTLERRQIDEAEAGEITDYRFSPDGNWLAYAKPMPNGYGSIHLYALRSGQSHMIGTNMHNDAAPRWDPAGKYLYLLSQRHLDPIIDETDFNHIYLNSTKVFAIPLAETTPPPLHDAARAVGVDLDQWAKGGADDEKSDDDGAAEVAADPNQPAVPGVDADEEPMQVDLTGMAQRLYALPVDAGNYTGLEALNGGVAFLSSPVKGLLSDDWGQAKGLGAGDAELVRLNLAKEDAAEARTVLAERVDAYAVNAERSVIVFPTADGFSKIDLKGEPKPKPIKMDSAKLRVDMLEEWQQIFDEAWRLQRDFYWAPNYSGVDWPAMRDKYAALLPRIGTRDELSDLIKQMIGELATSHTYVWGGQRHDRVDPVSVGLLGADIAFDGTGFRIESIIPGQSWSKAIAGPLEQVYLDVDEGNYVLAINGITLSPRDNIYDLLQDQAGRPVTLTIADDALGANRRDIDIRTMRSERALRYAAWVEANRTHVEEMSNGRIGYVHLPDMDTRGLIEFRRQFYPQHDKVGIIMDVRDNGGGFVSQMIIERLSRRPITYDQPRHGVSHPYPLRAVRGHLVTLIDQHAGSDGDIFPDAFRKVGLGPLIGTRTWGGVVGIRADKAHVDLGISTQPEFAMWDERGWPLENTGVEPDIEVDITPQDRAAGRDPQLDRAIEYLLQRLDEDPRDKPKAPPYPVRTGR